MVGFAKDYPWLIPLLPLLAALVIGAFGKWLKGWSHVPAILGMAGSFALAMGLLLGLSSGAIEPIRDLVVFPWIVVGGFHVDAALTVDALTAVYLSFITGIGLLIFIYSVGYMKGDYGYWRFFAYLSLFVFFMTVLVMGNNFVLLYLGWEGVGLASYLLIGYYYPRPSAVAAAKKAFITNRIGDFGLAIGIFLIYRYFGSVQYSVVFEKLHDSAFLTPLLPILQYIPFCLMLGAFGKSAQFPLHVWLPDAMEGPTPVSALIHAATMVTAGIYLIARTMPLFLMDPTNHAALNVVACVGGFTSFLAASIALCQYDLKRIWAYSTLSQLGYMFLALGLCTAGNTEPAGAAVFHVFTHAWFKALLFLSAGSVLHAMGGELDIRKMSGLRKVMPITHLTMLVGCLALAGVPGLAGFFSKDEIIHAALNSTQGPGFALGILSVLVALMTAYYTFRLFFKVFWGPLELPATAGQHEASPFALAEEQGHGGHGDEHAHDEHGHGVGAASKMRLDGSPLMWMPLVALSIGAIFAGYLGTHVTGDWIHHFLATAMGGGVEGEAAAGGEGTGRVGEGFMLGLSFVVSGLGIATAFYFFKVNRHAADIVGANFKPLVNFLYNKWYIDEVYAAALIKPLRVLGHILNFVDKYVVDTLVAFVGFAPQVVGYSLKPTQRGILQRYALGMVAGAAAVVLGALYLLR